MSSPVLSRFFTPSPPRPKRTNEDLEIHPVERDPKRRKLAKQPSYTPRAMKTSTRGQFARSKSDYDAKKLLRKRELLGSAGECVPKKEKQSKPTSQEDTEDTTPFTAFYEMVNQSATKSARKKAEEVGPKGKPWTDLEKQILVFKKENPGVLLMFEVGYKYKFYGEDAKAAAQALNIIAYDSHNFLTASIPAFKREVHLKKLLSEGHTVGIVEQIETAAVKKAGDTRNQIFGRKLTRLHTAATYSHQMGSADDIEGEFSPPLMFLMERGTDKGVAFSVIAISLSTGDVVWDDFNDTPLRNELETRVAHLQPHEIILSTDGLVGTTEQMLKAVNEFRGSEYNSFQIKRLSGSFSYTDAYELVSQFYVRSASSASNGNAQIIAEITAYPKPVVILLAHAIAYLKPYGVSEALLSAQFHSRFTATAHMLLSASTLTNLEIYHNNTDGSTTGSLLAILDQTHTKFGARLLRTWVGKPLTDIRLLGERIDAVEEILASQSVKIRRLQGLLKGLPDLANGLTHVQYGKCSTRAFAKLIDHCNRLATAFDEAPEGFKSPLLNRIYSALPRLKEPIRQITQDISLSKAAEGLKTRLWINAEKFPDVTNWQELVDVTEAELHDELGRVRKLLQNKNLSWKTIAGDEYLIELEKTSYMPPEVAEEWELISSTKSLVRYRTPATKAKLSERARYKELLHKAADEAYKSYLEEVTQKYYSTLREGVNNIAIADCLFSLAGVARREGYVRPEFTSIEGVLDIQEGRHPMAEIIRPDPFIPNSIWMDSKQRCFCLTGPNMGGKSSTVRMIALIVIMAQIGSYVPASAARLSFVDGIYTRMGASDNLARGRSTFMSEMAETSDILAGATSQSLVILDELGRGTSTFDGMSIASAVLQYLLESIRCRTLFITHYPSVVLELEKKHPQELINFHMDFMETSLLDGTRDITFLYKIVQGCARKSFGVECARLAGIHPDILTTATRKAEDMQQEVDNRRRKMRALKLLGLALRSVKSSDTTALACLIKVNNQQIL